MKYFNHSKITYLFRLLGFAYLALFLYLFIYNDFKLFNTMSWLIISIFALILGVLGMKKQKSEFALSIILTYSALLTIFKCMFLIVFYIYEMSG